jgi:hypothetical protein
MVDRNGTPPYLNESTYLPNPDTGVYINFDILAAENYFLLLNTGVGNIFCTVID